MEWAQFGRWGHGAGGLGAIRAVCRAYQAFKMFLAVDMDMVNLRVSATSASPIPVTHQVLMQNTKYVQIMRVPQVTFVLYSALT